MATPPPFPSRPSGQEEDGLATAAAVQSYIAGRRGVWLPQLWADGQPPPAGGPPAGLATDICKHLDDVGWREAGGFFSTVPPPPQPATRNPTSAYHGLCVFAWAGFQKGSS